MRIALASDHAGFAQLKDLEDFVDSLGHEAFNFGPKKLNPADDYPDFIVPAAVAVAKGECERGIILGGSGQGEAIVANKIKGVRCAVFYGPAVPRKVVDAETLGKAMGVEILKKGYKKIVFDRGGYKYHGRIKALADGLRQAGLNF